MGALKRRRTIDPRRIEVVSGVMAGILRAKTGAERLQMAGDMFASARGMLVAYLRHEHPDWDERRVALEASRRLSHGAC